MAGSYGLDLALGAGAAGFEFVAGVGSMYTGSGTWIKIYGVWVKDKLLGFHPFFLSTALLSQQGSDFFFFLPWINSSTSI